MVLTRVDIVLPDTDEEFFDQLTGFLGFFGYVEDQHLRFRMSNPHYNPVLGLTTAPVDIPVAVMDGKTIKIQNTTGVEKENQWEYTPLSLTDVIKRLELYPLNLLDHIGFNLPYFDGVHPEISELRNEFKNECLYHQFPSGEPWDFILPGSTKEISGADIDYSATRKPKLEIVSFDGCSTPIIQIDFSVNATYNEIVSTFPEGINDDNLHNVWVYVQNPYSIDICFVVNEPVEGDWSDFFEGSRLT